MLYSYTNSVYTIHRLLAILTMAFIYGMAMYGIGFLFQDVSLQRTVIQALVFGIMMSFITNPEQTIRFDADTFSITQRYFHIIRSAQQSFSYSSIRSVNKIESANNKFLSLLSGSMQGLTINYAHAEQHRRDATILLRNFSESDIDAMVQIFAQHRQAA
ncbi:MAG: hypothetical protein JNL32_13100 [Candidatus Kapabacteria bacterium]|nr:hypothetical protein [Candidatus Kapabacteria bacterium]